MRLSVPNRPRIVNKTQTSSSKKQSVLLLVRSGFHPDKDPAHECSDGSVRDAGGPRAKSNQIPEIADLWLCHTLEGIGSTRSVRTSADVHSIT
jgi:hypothetical protein